jgi:hypothetical protein
MGATYPKYSKLYTASVRIDYGDSSTYTEGDDLTSACELIHSDDSYDVSPNPFDGLIITAIRTLDSKWGFKVSLVVGVDARILSAVCYDGGNDPAFIINPNIRDGEVAFTKFEFDVSRNAINPIDMDNQAYIFTITYQKALVD